MRKPVGITAPYRQENDDDDIQDYKKPWVGLTDEEMYKLWLGTDETMDRIAFGKAVQAKLKELNT